MDPLFVPFFSWVKTQGPFVSLAILVLWYNRSGQWLWKREVDDKIAAAKSETVAQALLTQIWKDRSEEWKLSSNKWEGMALKTTTLATVVVSGSKDTGAAA